MSYHTRTEDEKPSPSTIQSPTDSVSNTPTAAKRRRTSASGSRGVANLTPEQLAKKRANDREAQRAIRERTKSQIETLEKRVQELTAQQPYQDLQFVIQRKEAVEAENEDIKNRLNAVIEIIGPLLGSRGLRGDSDTPPYRDPQLQSAGTSPHINTVTQDPSYTPNSARHYAAPSSISLVPSTPYPFQWQNPNGSPSTVSNRVTFGPNPGGDHPRTIADHGNIHSLHSVPPSMSPYDLGQQGQRIIKRSQMSQRNGPALPADSHITLATPIMPRPNRGYLDESRQDINQPMYSTLAKNVPATCPLDGLLLDFRAEQKRRVLSGVPLSEIVGPAYPDFSSLVQPERSIYSHPLSKILTDILNRFPDLCTFPEKLGVLYVVFVIMRWQVAPTPENYDRLPAWSKPIPSQLTTPHPAWMDFIPWPQMRQQIVLSHEQYPFDLFIKDYMGTVRVNWPYEPLDAILPLAQEDNFTMNPVFERHIRRLESWSLGSAFAKTMPSLAEFTVIRDPEEPTVGSRKGC